MRLAIVIVTHRSPDMALSCLASLAPQLEPGIDRVILVDNGSDGDTPARLRAELENRDWTSWVSLVLLAQNGGFAVGSNAGLRIALAAADPPRYCMLLNDDTIVQPGALATMLEVLEGDESISLAASGLEDPDGRPRACAFRFPGVVSELERALRFGPVSRLLAPWAVAPPPPDGPVRADWVAFAALLARREVFERIGLLDEHFFLYFDDIEFCLRARRAGFEVWLLPQSRITHLRGQTTGMRSENWSARRVPPYWFQSRRYFFEKAYGWWYAVAVDAAAIGGTLLRRVLSLAGTKRDPDPPRYLRDLVRSRFAAKRRDPVFSPSRPGFGDLDAERLPVVRVEGIDVQALTLDESVAVITQRLLSRRGGWLLSLNLQHLHLCARDPAYAALCSGATLSLADGMPIVWASRLQGAPLPGRIAGSDLVVSLAAAAQRHGFSIFLLGGSPGAAEGAAASLTRSFPDLRIAGIACPPLGFELDPAETERLTEALIAARPDLVYVAFGKPKAEYMIDVWRRRLPETWFLGVGISLSFLSGEVRRAPEWMRKLGLEWIHRLAQEPRRLARRYLIEGLPFAARLFVRSFAVRRTSP